MLASASAGLTLVVSVVVVAGDRAGDDPVGEFAGVLVSTDAATAGRIGAYAAATLLPLAAVLAVVAVAVVDVGRPSGLRAAAGGAAGFVLLGGAYVVLGDAGPAATGVGWGAAAARRWRGADPGARRAPRSPSVATRVAVVGLVGLVDDEVPAVVAVPAAVDDEVTGLPAELGGSGQAAAHAAAVDAGDALGRLDHMPGTGGSCLARWRSLGRAVDDRRR